MNLVIATQNAGKLAEFREILVHLPYEIVSLATYPNLPEIEETGATFAENAALKAETVAALTGELALADDSGLEVDALNGRPGIFSARFAGVHAGDEANNKKLLEELAGIPQGQRTARFRAVIAIAQPGRQTEFAEGVCEGFIVSAPQGAGGFGYDPLFFVPQAKKTFAQMTPQEKNSISHRARAMAQATEVLKRIASTK
jgi:XTP/dITP diphosphohydrolase